MDALVVIEPYSDEWPRPVPGADRQPAARVYMRDRESYTDAKQLFSEMRLRGAAHFDPEKTCLPPVAKPRSK